MRSKDPALSLSSGKALSKNKIKKNWLYRDTINGNKYEFRRTFIGKQIGGINNLRFKNSEKFNDYFLQYITGNDLAQYTYIYFIVDLILIVDLIFI